MKYFDRKIKFLDKLETKQVGILLIILGIFIPSMLYPFTSLTPEAKEFALEIGWKGGTYKTGLNDREIVFVEGENEQGKYEGRLSIPYKYPIALGILLSFIGISFATFGQKEKTDERLSGLNQSEQDVLHRPHKDLSSNSYIFQCEHCGQNLRFPIKKELLKVKCTSCKNTFYFQNGERVTS